MFKALFSLPLTLELQRMNVIETDLYATLFSATSMRFSLNNKLCAQHHLLLLTQQRGNKKLCLLFVCCKRSHWQRLHSFIGGVHSFAKHDSSERASNKSALHVATTC